MRRDRIHLLYCCNDQCRKTTRHERDERLLSFTCMNCGAVKTKRYNQPKRQRRSQDDESMDPLN